MSLKEYFVPFKNPIYKFFASYFKLYVLCFIECPDEKCEKCHKKTGKCKKCKREAYLTVEKTCSLPSPKEGQLFISQNRCCQDFFPLHQWYSGLKTHIKNNANNVFLDFDK